MPLVSIIMPIYNVEKYLRTSASCALNQTLEDIELILVDDGSRDSCGKICDELAESNSRVRVIHQANAGVAAARNAGIEAAEGEYIYFFDPDDTIELNLVEENYALAKKYDADIVCFGYRDVWLSKDGSVVKELLTCPPKEDALSRDEFWRGFRSEKGHYSVWSRLFRRKFVIDNKLRFPPFHNGEDAYFLFSAYDAPFNRLVHNPKAYYSYIHRRGTATTKFDPQRIEDEYKSSRKYVEVLSRHSEISGGFDDLIRRKYVMGLCMTVGAVCRAGKTLELEQKLDIIKNAAAREGVKRALDEISVGSFHASGLRLKVFLLKRKMYRTVIFLGEAANKFKRA